MNIPKPGDKYIVVHPFSTANLRSYKEGDILELVEMTADNPFGWPAGKDALPNWIVKCPHFGPGDKEAVWTSLWHAITNGIIKYQGESDETSNSGQ